MMSNKSPVWNGPSVLVPLPTDVLLIGQGDVNAETTWANLKNNYYKMWNFGVSAQPAPFIDGKCPPVGAHLMWTLPNSLRQGKQQAQTGAAVNFPQAPNRWLVTRFAFNNSSKALSSTPTVVQSDLLIDPQGGIQNVNQYPYYNEDPDLGVRQIGSSVPLEQYNGENNGTVDLKAVGPGDVAWSVAYDNSRNVFALHDELPDETQTYLYSVIGWFSDPETDPLNDLPTDSNKDWLSILEKDYSWTSEDVDQAETDWLNWKTLFGLTGDWDPSTLNLPDQAKAMIEKWHKWQQANGNTTEVPNLPKQSLYHSMIATVQWKGKNKSYGTGAPIGGNGEQKLPTVTIANTPESAISTFMATKASEVQGSGITKQDIPNLSIALEAFQRGLLFDLQSDPQWAEDKIHDAKFDKKYRGQEWIVVRTVENNTATVSENNRAGQQSIPLDATQTQLLIDLNKLQSELNTLGLMMNTRKQELYALAMKQEFLQYNRSTIDEKALKELNEKVLQSSKAMSTELATNHTTFSQLETEIETKASDLTSNLADKYELSVVDLDPTADPADPVVLISGSELDTKILPPEYNGHSHLLPIRFTGQTITTINVTYAPVQAESIAITWQDILNKITLPTWNAIPKEVLNLWLEALLLNTGSASLIADIYFTKADKQPDEQQLKALIEKIQAQQTACWTEFKTQPPTEALTQVCGYDGLLPDPVGVAYRPDKNPWTPIFMDWKIRWIPSSQDVTNSLKDWELGDHDYQWVGAHLDASGSEIIFQGRSILNLKTTQNIQTRFTTFKEDINYNNLPQNTVKNLDWVSNNIQYMDIVTQSMSGLTQQLNTLLVTMKNRPLDSNINSLLDDSSYFAPQTGGTSQPDGIPDYAIRSGHFQMMDLRLVDSFGQVLPAKSNLLGPNDPIAGIIWSHSMQTSSPNFNGKTSTYGQLPPRISQDAVMYSRLLQRDNDQIFTNSSDSTSPICGWVMANHLDDALMVFDADGKSLGEVIKVRREVDGGESSLTVRWDAAPGTNTQLGAEPNIENEHLKKFIIDLLKTGVSNSGAQAYSELMSHIDSSLWLNNTLKKNQGNLAILLGRPLAVVRAEVKLELAGDPVYNQSWFETGKFYNNDGSFKPEDPSFVSVKFNVRIGDSQLKKNGVMGYFVNDDYSTFYAVYGNSGQTASLHQHLKHSNDSRSVEQMKADVTTESDSSSGYVVSDHLVSLSANQSALKLTLIMEPFGDLTITPGSLPGSSVSLPNGPITAALENLSATFRCGPLLLDPTNITMPTPSEVKGNWGWVARKDVTDWQPGSEITNSVPQAELGPAPLKLIEGWLSLADFNKQ